MAALRNLFMSVLGGSLPHAPDDRNGGEPSVRSLALVRAPSTALQIIGKTDEADTVASIRENAADNLRSVGSEPIEDFQGIEHHAVLGPVGLLHTEIDLRFLTVERIVAEQAASLTSLRQLALQLESKMTCLSRNIERLCEKAGTENVEMISDEQRGEIARRKMNAVMAVAGGSAPLAGSEPRTEPARYVHCPNCLSRDTRGARRLTTTDRCLRVLALNARRCRSCGSRFYRIRWTASPDISKVVERWSAFEDRARRLTGIWKSKDGKSRSKKYIN